MKKHKLVQEQLDRRIALFRELKDEIAPPEGWIYSIRQGINMSLRQLGARLSITPQSVREIEERERTGSISLKVLKQVADALDMHFVYGFIPGEGSLEKMVEKRASELSRQIVERASTHMKLEDQEISSERLGKAILEKTEDLTRELPKYLWNQTPDK